MSHARKSESNCQYVHVPPSDSAVRARYEGVTHTRVHVRLIVLPELAQTVWAGRRPWPIAEPRRNRRPLGACLRRSHMSRPRAVLNEDHAFIVWDFEGGSPNWIEKAQTRTRRRGQHGKPEETRWHHPQESR